MTAETDRTAATRTERRHRSQAAILDAARALFARNGFEHTTIRASPNEPESTPRW